MQTIGHRIALASAALIVAALTVNTAVAETTTVRVPFTFKVAGETFPAGNYSISHDGRGNFVTLAARDSSQSFSAIVGPGTPSPYEYKIALKFDLVGGTHHLQSIQYGTMITSQLDKKALQSERSSLEHSGGR